MNLRVFFVWLLGTGLTYPVGAQGQPVEIHHRLQLDASLERRVALTLDACGGKFDRKLIEFLIQQHIPATLFVTKKWLAKNAKGAAIIKAHSDLFDVEDHGEKHIPAVIGVGKRVYGISGHPDVLHLHQEIAEGAHAIAEVFGATPRWYRGATAKYDTQAEREITSSGFQIAGFSVNADSGATAGKKEIARRLKQVKTGDIIIAHMNKPASESAQGLAIGLQKLKQQGFQFVRMNEAQVIVVP